MKTTIRPTVVPFLLFCLCLVLAAMQTSAATIAASGRVLHVSQESITKQHGDLRLSTINAALQMAHPGDTLTIAPGTYREQIRIPVSGLRIVGSKGKDGAPAVVIAPPSSIAGAPLVSDAHDTEWRDISFVGEGGTLLELRGFTGLFAHCRFDLSRPFSYVNIHGGSPELFGCVFLGSPGTVSTVVIHGEQGKESRVTFAHSLFQNFGVGALLLRGDQDVSAINCLFASCGGFHIRENGVASRVSALNSVFYLMAEPRLVRQEPDAPRTLLDTCLYTPAPGLDFSWRALPLEAQGEIDSVNCLTASPRFTGGRLTLLNLCIDDARNLPVWDRLCEKLGKLSLPLTVALDTRSMTKAMWQMAAKRVEQGHEVATHTVTHSSLLLRDVIRLAYSGEADSAEADIDANKRLSLKVDGKPLVVLDLNDPALTLGRLVEALQGAGVRAELSAMNARDIPASFLAETWRQDILFPTYAVSLALDTTAYRRFALRTSRLAVEAAFKEIGLTNWGCPAAVCPFGEFSDSLAQVARDAGYSIVRGYAAVSSLNSFDQVSIFPLRNVSSNTLARNAPLAEREELYRVFLDILKYHGGAIGFYSHGFDEMRESEWETLFALLEQETVVKVKRFADIAKWIEENCLAVRPGVYSCPEDVSSMGEVSFMPAADSPLRGAGKPTPYRTNFAGESLPENAAPNIGLY